MTIVKHRFVERGGFKVCMDCGICSEEKRIYNGPERMYDKRDVYTKKHNEILDLDYQLSFDPNESDNPSKWFYLKRINGAFMNDMDVRRSRIFRGFLMNFNFPFYIEKEIIRTFKRFFKKANARGRDLRDIFISIIILILKKNDFPFLIQEIIEALNMKELNYRTYQIVAKTLEERSQAQKISTIFMYYCKKYFEFNPLMHRYNQICRKIEEHPYSLGKDPKGIAGAIIYHYGFQTKKIKQKTIAENLNITEVTLRNNFKILKKSLNKVFQED